MIEKRIETFIRANEEDEETFQTLMIELFRKQFEENAPYRAFCQEKRKTPRTVKRWQDIPFVPVDAFKHLTLSRVPVEETVACFMTSGSTSGQRGKHYHADLTIYDASMDETVRRFVVDRPMRIACLFPRASELPNSSLAHYLNRIVNQYGKEGSGYFIDSSGIAFDAFASFLKEATCDDEPVLLLGATFSYVHLFDHFQETTFTLPKGSRVFDTGGYKGQSEALPEATFYETLSAQFGVPLESCVNMYGMSELSTQYYDRGHATSPAVKVGPPWIRTRIIDPLTGDDLPYGETGIIVHYDLANTNAVTAVMTEDVGYAHEDGFVLLGRAEGAEAKGCSLQLADFLQVTGGTR